MDTKLSTVIAVMESLVKLNKWTVLRFDIQAFYTKYTDINGYAGYLDVKEIDKRIIIRGNGSFEMKED